MTKRMIDILAKKINYYPELCQEWGGYLTYVEAKKLKEAGFKFSCDEMVDYCGDKSKKGENGSTWYYFTKDFRIEDLWKKL